MSLTLIERLKKDEEFRAKIFLCLSFIVNVAYAIFLCAVGIVEGSNWFLVMATYYLALSLLRIFIFSKTSGKKSLRVKIKSARACGFFLVLLNFVVSVMMQFLLYGDKRASYHEIVVITLATYTFYALITSIVGYVKSVKKEDCLLLSIRVLSLVSAAVSITTLTSTMLATFGTDNEPLRWAILPLLCIVVSVFIIVIAVFLIRKANEHLRRE